MRQQIKNEVEKLIDSHPKLTDIPPFQLDVDDNGMKILMTENPNAPLELAQIMTGQEIWNIQEDRNQKRQLRYQAWILRQLYLLKSVSELALMDMLEKKEGQMSHEAIEDFDIAFKKICKIVCPPKELKSTRLPPNGIKIPSITLSDNPEIIKRLTERLIELRDKPDRNTEEACELAILKYLAEAGSFTGRNIFEIKGEQDIFAFQQAYAKVIKMNKGNVQSGD